MPFPCVQIADVGAVSQNALRFPIPSPGPAGLTVEFLVWIDRVLTGNPLSEFAWWTCTTSDTAPANNGQAGRHWQDDTHSFNVKRAASGSDTYRTTQPAGFGAPGWHRLSYRWKAGEVPAIFVDGVAMPLDSATPSPALSASLVWWWIANWDANSLDFEGKLADVRVWQSFRTDAEIADWAWLRLQGNEPGLIHYFRCDEGAGTSLGDTGPGGIDGVLVGVGNGTTWEATEEEPLLPELQGPRWDLTLFGDDGAPLFGLAGSGGDVVYPCFSTDPRHPRPWLDWPTDASGAEVDFLRGRVKVGQYNVLVADARAVATDRASGQLTAILGAYQGLNGLRCRLTYTDAAGVTVVAADGPASTIRLHSSYSGFTWGVKDENARAKKVRAFDRTGTTCVFPRGPLEPYGLLPSGKYAVPAAGVVRGTYEGDGTQGIVTFSLAQEAQWRRVLTDAMRRASEFAWDTAAQAYVLRNCTIRWRAAGAGDWPAAQQFVDMPAYQRTGFFAALLGEDRDILWRTLRVTLRMHNSAGQERKYEGAALVTGIYLRAPAGAVLPANGQAVELQVVYTGPASEDYPLHFDGTAGEFLARALDGDWCSEPLGIRYDADVLASYTQPCSARITEPTDDLLGWLAQHWCQPQAAALALDGDGRISPVRYLLPDESEALVTLNDAVCRPTADWSHPDSNVLNEVELVYYRDVLVDLRDDVLGEISAGDGVRPVEVRIRTVEADGGPSHQRFGAKKHEIRTQLFRALGRSDGTAASGEGTSEVGHVLGIERGFQLLDRFLYGAQAYTAQTLRSLTGDLRLGSWVENGCSWLPDYISGARGSNRVAQVIGIRDLDPVRRDLVLLDGGDSLAPLAQPTVGAAAENVAGGVTLPVTAVAPGTQAVVEFAVSLAEPAHDSDLWTPAGRLSAPGDVSTPPLPAGASVWIGARSVAAERRPSLRTPAQQVVLAATPRLTGVRVVVSEADNSVTVSWTQNPYALGARIYYRVAATEDGGDPDPGDFVDASASAGSVVLPISALAGQLVTIDAEGWTGWTGAAVDGAAGPKVRAYGGLGVGPVIRSLSVLHDLVGTMEASYTLSETVTEVRIWRRNGASPLAGGIPDDRYALAPRAADVLSQSWAVVNGTYHVVVRAYDGEGRYHEEVREVLVDGVGGGGGGGGGGGAITVRPTTPAISQGPLDGMGNRRVILQWINTSSALDIEVSWEGDATHTQQTEPAGAETANAWKPIGAHVIARARYTDGVNVGPWSGYSDELEVTGGL